MAQRLGTRIDQFSRNSANSAALGEGQREHHRAPLRSARHRIWASRPTSRPTTCASNASRCGSRSAGGQIAHRFRRPRGEDARQRDGGGHDIAIDDLVD
jgi:hypothetical protein